MNNSKPKQPVTSGAVIFTIAFFFIIFLVFKCSCSQTEEQVSKNKEQNSKITALTAAQEEVKSRLKSPSSANFPWGIDCVTKISDNTYVINSYVDSQNSFGAMLRTNFTCQITLNDNDTYTCNSVELLE
ncbi:hypothetical protein [Flavobacterium ammonificans]|uniref:Lipoprotein n=1 Tax=Flavobacterium ammonificans TaxID=1751056 RepID=A0ABM7UXK2_9FLAO|nr:hypothetical protein [Flavobacterium ammonificans]BDB52112.1 hypothetical protein GENT11_04240 [Flavobacterium ammonificans]